MGEKVRLAILIILTLFMTSQIFTRELVSLKVSAGFVTLYASKRYLDPIQFQHYLYLYAFQSSNAGSFCISDE